MRKISGCCGVLVTLCAGIVPDAANAQSSPIDRIEAIERQMRGLQSEMRRLKSELGEARQQLRQSRSEAQRAQNQLGQAREAAQQAQQDAVRAAAAQTQAAQAAAQAHAAATVGYFKPWFSLYESQSSNDFLLMERPSIVEIARNAAPVR